MQLVHPVLAAAVAVIAAASPSKAPRVVSLAPSLTEIAYRIGCGPQLVADTSFDDYPPAARALPHVADLVTVDLERLSTLEPSVVLALHDQEHEAEPVARELGIPVSYLPNRGLDDLYADIKGVGAGCERPRRASELAGELRAQLAQLEREASAYPTHPKVLFLLDLPGFTAGAPSFLDDLIRLAGGINVAGRIPQPYPDVSSEFVLQADPDVIVAARAMQFGPDAQAREPWRSLRAVREGRVVRPPSDDILERDGPRIVLGLAWLIKAIHAP